MKPDTPKYRDCDETKWFLIKRMRSGTGGAGDPEIDEKLCFISPSLLLSSSGASEAR